MEFNGVQDIWSPVTPVKNNSTKRQLVSSPNYGQRNQLSEPSWLDLVSGLETSNPSWGFSFQNGVCGTPGFQNYLQDFNGGQAVAEASASRATVNNFSPHSAIIDDGNAALMNYWTPRIGKMQPLAPLIAKNGNCQVFPHASNQLLLNGKVLLPQSCCNRSCNCVFQRAQYGSTVTHPPNLNAFSEPTMNFSGTGTMPSLLNHVNYGIYSQKMQYEQQSMESINIANGYVRNEHESFSNLMASSEYACFQNPDFVKDLAVLPDEISYQVTGMEKSLVEGDKELIDLDDASKQKPKRKKHRPKVVIEGKPVRTPKVATPKQKTPKAARDTENATGKRKYTRRKKDATPCSETNAVKEIVDAESHDGSKPVRRSLNFDSEESPEVDKFSLLISMFMQNLEKAEQNTCEDGNLASERLKETVNSTVVQGPIVENSLSGIVYDLRGSTNEPQNEYLKILQTSQCTSIDQNVEASNNIVKSNRVLDSPYNGRDHYRADEASLLARKNLLYNDGNLSSENHNAERLSACPPVINKRMRKEKNWHNGINPSTILTYTPTIGWKSLQTPNNSQEIKFTDTMNLMAKEQLQTLEPGLLSQEADVNINNYPIPRNNLNSLTELMDFNRNTTALNPSLQNNKDIRQPPTPDKLSGYSNNQENNICGTMVQFEMPEDVNKSMKVKGKRGRKKREANHETTLCPSQSSTIVSHGQINLGATTTTSTHFHGKNLPNEIISFNKHDTLNCKTSTNSSISSFSPSRNSMDYIVEKLSQLSINGDDVVSSQAQNAIVPYARNGVAVVPYDGIFDQAKRRRPRAKVDLDPETNRAWKLLMGIEGEGNEGANVDKELWWEEERRVFRGRVDSFIARMHLVQGDRRFSQWKGSVVDSVIGVFLTQNVSDHLSSSAFMAMAAKFHLRSEGNSMGSNAEKANTTRENPTMCIKSLTETHNLQRNTLDHEFYRQTCLKINAIQSDGKMENSSRNETFGSGTGSSNIIYDAGKFFESHDTEQSFGQESANSTSSTVFTMAPSINSVEIEDKRLVEEVVSSQNSGVSSQNSMGFQVPSADHTTSNSMLNVEADYLQIGSLNNGFGQSSFTELLHIAESNMFQDLFSHSSMPSANSSVVHTNGSNSPVLDHMDNSKVTCQPCQANSISNHELLGLSNKLPEADFFLSPNASNFTTMENSAKPVKKEIITSLQSATCEINKFEVNHCKCSGPTVENLAESYSPNKFFSTSGTANAIDSYLPMRISSAEQSTSLEAEIGINQQNFNHKKMIERTDTSSNIENSYGNTNIQVKDMARFQQKYGHSTFEAEMPQEAITVQSQMENYPNLKTSSTSNDQIQNKLEADKAVGSIMKDESYNFQNVSLETPKQGEKVKKKKVDSEKKTFDWDSLRREIYRNKSTEERSSGTMDSLDWEAVRCADVSEIAATIRERGMNNMLAERIKDFLERLVRDHGSIDLEWLRDVPPDKSKDFLLSIRGLGLKSAECVRLLTLHHLAFPVDTNVGRICVRLGWVPLQPLPESLQLHLLELYPVLETIQKYLWPRLCKLDQRTLYELHYQMITFGKVFCTKSKPNCNACPMRGECRHFASAFASARLALPPPEDKSIVSSTYPIASEPRMTPTLTSSSILQLECNSSVELTAQKISEPIIEEPTTPELECPGTLESEIEDAFFEDPDEIPTIKLNFEKFTENLQNYMQENMELQAADMSNALVALTPGAASIPMPKLKNISRLRTEHQVYEIPDSHPLLEGFEQREPDDPCPYLLAIWTPGETAQSTEPPKACCDSQDTGQLCDRSTCFGCNSIRESQAHKVRGTLLIPCRTAMRGSFPLNGTYFQVNEVFADHHTSRNPIDIPRDWIWNLPRRTVCFGTSIPTIFRGLTTEEIQQCFWRGFVCVRGFDRITRAPKPLYARLHFPASKAPKTSKGGVPAAAVAD